MAIHGKPDGNPRCHSIRALTTKRFLWGRKPNTYEKSILLTGDLSLPKPVEIAILARLHLRGVGLKLSHGLILRGKVVTKHSRRGHELYPLDIVSIRHGVLHGSHRDTVATFDFIFPINKDGIQSMKK